MSGFDPLRSSLLLPRLRPEVLLIVSVGLREGETAACVVPLYPAVQEKVHDQVAPLIMRPDPSRVTHVLPSHAIVDAPPDFASVNADALDTVGIDPELEQLLAHVPLAPMVLRSDIPVSPCGGLRLCVYVLNRLAGTCSKGIEEDDHREGSHVANRADLRKRQCPFNHRLAPRLPQLELLLSPCKRSIQP